MSILNSLNTCHFNGKKIGDPIINRRNLIITGLKKQISSLQETGVQNKRPWFRTDDEGLKGSIRFMNKPFDLGKGKNYFLIKNENELIDIYNNVIQEIVDEKLDDVIEKHVSSIKSRKQ